MGVTLHHASQKIPHQITFSTFLDLPLEPLLLRLQIFFQSSSIKGWLRLALMDFAGEAMEVEEMHYSPLFSFLEMAWPKPEAQVDVSSELSFKGLLKFNSEETVTWACSLGHLHSIQTKALHPKFPKYNWWAVGSWFEHSFAFSYLFKKIFQIYRLPTSVLVANMNMNILGEYSFGWVCLLHIWKICLNMQCKFFNPLSLCLWTK